MADTEKIVILENIRSCHNVGALFRTADAAGFHKIYCTGYTPIPPDRRIEKVSLGAENYLAWEKVEDTEILCQQLQSNGFSLIALEQTAQAQNIFHYKPQQKKLALILGNEVEGVTSSILALADTHLEIPMYGQKSSLNVSVAAGIAFYALR